MPSDKDIIKGQNACYLAIKFTGYELGIQSCYAPQVRSLTYARMKNTRRGIPFPLKSSPKTGGRADSTAAGSFSGRNGSLRNSLAPA